MSLPPNQVKVPFQAIELTEAQHAILAEMSEWFIGYIDGYPSVTEADPDGAVLTMALTQLSPLRDELVQAIDGAARSDVSQYLSDLELRGAPEFELLRTLLVGRYLSCRPVWRVLGYTGRIPVPIRPGETEEYLNAELLEPSRSRGKTYRPTS